MKKSQAYYDLFDRIRSRKRITDSYLKKYWSYRLEPAREQELLLEVMLVGKRVDSLAMLLKWMVQLHIIAVTRCQ